MFPEPSLLSSDTFTPSRSVSLGHSLSPSPEHMARSSHDYTLLTPLGVGPVVFSEV